MSSILSLATAQELQPYFDAFWYLETYQDVASAGMDAWQHARLFALLQLPPRSDPHTSAVHEAATAWLRGKSREELDAIASAQDIPLYTMA